MAARKNGAKALTSISLQDGEPTSPCIDDFSLELSLPLGCLRAMPSGMLKRNKGSHHKRLLKGRSEARSDPIGGR